MTYSFQDTAGVTFGSLIETTYRRLLSGQRDVTCILTNALTDTTSTSFPLSGVQTNMVTPGGILSIDMEVMYIQSWDGINVTVVRGYAGSTAATHAAATVVYCNPKFTKFDIGVAINDDLRDLSSPEKGLYRIESTAITYNPVFQGYDLGDLPKNFIDVLSINYRIAPPSHNFPAIRRWRVQRAMFNSFNVADSIFPSGQGIQIYEPGFPGLPMYVMASAPFLPLVNLTDDVTQTPYNNLDKDDAPNNLGNVVPLGTDGKPLLVSNLPSTAIDLPILGAQIALMAPREIKRNFIEGQPDPRKSADVPVGAITSSVKALIALRESRLSAEADRLSRQYNVRLRGW